MYHFGSKAIIDAWLYFGCTVILTTAGPSLPVVVELEIHGKTAPISIQIHNFLSLCPPPQISQWKQWHLNLLLVPEYLGDIGLKLRKMVFKMHIFSWSYFLIQNTCNWVSHSAIAYAYGSKMWRASSLIISRNVRKHRACIKQRNLQWRCVCFLTQLTSRSEGQRSNMRKLQTKM